MYVKTDKWSPSRKLVAIGWDKLTYSISPSRHGGGEYVSINFPIIATARKDARTVLYGGVNRLFLRRSAFPYAQDELSPDLVAQHMDRRGSMQVSMSEDGLFNTLTDLPGPAVVRWVHLLQHCHDFLSIAPEGFIGWYTEEKAK